MKIALFERRDGSRCVGAVVGDEVVDLTDWVGALGPRPLAAFLARPRDEVPLTTAVRVPVDELQWLPPSLGGSPPLCVGLNYRDHAKEIRAARGATTDPSLFTRYWPSLVGHRGQLTRPRASEQFDIEGELVVVIGTHCRHVPRDQALGVIAGYTIGLDGSIRDWQRKAGMPTAGKNFTTTGAMGPWMVTADEIADPAALHVITRVNGVVLQDSPTAQMIFDVPTLIEHISTFMPLAPGDAIFTGTPAGTFLDRGGDSWLVPGDVVSVEISGIGTLQNHVIDEADDEVSSQSYIYP